jgi:DNA-binding PadR family transcriptional regulator
MTTYKQGRTHVTAEEIQYLKHLSAAGLRGRTISASTLRNGLKRLVQAGYVVGRAVSVDMGHYVITDLGRRTLAEHSLRDNLPLG